MEGMVSVSQMPSLSTPKVYARLSPFSVREIICTHFIDGLFEPERRGTLPLWKSWSQLGFKPSPLATNPIRLL